MSTVKQALTLADLCESEKQRICNVVRELLALKQSKSSWETEKKRLENQCKQLEQKMKSLEDAQNDKRDKEHDMDAQVRIQEQQLKESLEAEVVMSSQLVEDNHLAHGLMKFYQEEIMILAEQVGHLEGNLRSRDEAIGKAEKETQIMQQFIAEQRAKIETLELAKHSVDQDLQSRLMQLQEQLDGLTVKCHSQERMLLAAEKRYTDLQASKLCLEEEISSLHSSRSCFEEEIGNLRRALNEKTKLITQLGGQMHESDRPLQKPGATSMSRYHKFGEDGMLIRNGTHAVGMANAKEDLTNVEVNVYNGKDDGADITDLSRRHQTGHMPFSQHGSVTQASDMTRQAKRSVRNSSTALATAIDATLCSSEHTVGMSENMKASTVRDPERSLQSSLRPEDGQDGQNGQNEQNEVRFADAYDHQNELYESHLKVTEISHIKAYDSESDASGREYDSDRVMVRVSVGADDDGPVVRDAISRNVLYKANGSSKSVQFISTHVDTEVREVSAKAAPSVTTAPLSILKSRPTLTNGRPKVRSSPVSNHAASARERKSIQRNENAYANLPSAEDRENRNSNRKPESVVKHSTHVKDNTPSKVQCTQHKSQSCVKMRSSTDTVKVLSSSSSSSQTASVPSVHADHGGVRRNAAKPRHMQYRKERSDAEPRMEYETALFDLLDDMGAI